MCQTAGDEGYRSPDELRLSVEASRPDQKVTIISGETNPQFECRLLKLPAELREQIYDLACIPNYQRLFGRAEWIDARTVEDSSLWFRLPPLLSTCRQLRQEAAPVYFRGVRLLFDELHTCSLFLKALTPEHRAMIRFLGYCDCVKSAYESLGSARKPPTSVQLGRRLQSLEIMFGGENLKVEKALRICTSSIYCTKWPYEHDFIH